MRGPYTADVGALRVIVASMLALTIHAAQGVSPADIADAIKQSTEGHELQASCSATAFDAYQVRSGYQIVVAGPVGRIMAAANSAHQQHQPFEETDVTDALRAPVLTVKATMIMPILPVIGEIGRPTVVGGWSPSLPPTPARSPDPMALPDDSTGIVLRSTAKNEQGPVVLEPIGRLASSASSFDLTAFRAMPDADIEVVLMTSAHPSGGYSCKIDSKNRTSLR